MDPTDIQNLRIFSVEEVDGLIPTLTELVARQLGIAREIRVRLKTLCDKLGGEVESMDQLAPTPDDSADIAVLKRESRERILSYEDGWTEVQQLGAVVKDPRIGLLDFWGLYEGRYVWWCWLYGEEELGYFHELNAGFQSRRPVPRAGANAAAGLLAKPTVNRYLN